MRGFICAPLPYSQFLKCKYLSWKLMTTLISNNLFGLWNHWEINCIHDKSYIFYPYHSITLTVDPDHYITAALNSTFMYSLYWSLGISRKSNSDTTWCGKYPRSSCPHNFGDTTGSELFRFVYALWRFLQLCWVLDSMKDIKA